MSYPQSFSNSPFKFSQRTLANRQTPQRYGVGIALVVLVHAGALVAIKSGLEIRNVFRQTDPVITRAIPPVVPPTRPIEIAEPILTGFPTVAPTKPLVPQTIIEEPIAPPGQTTDNTGTELVATQAPEIAAAQVDPRHPLTQPDYPSQSRRLGEQGSVELLVFVLPNGRVGEARVAVGSGFARLDEAAVREALRGWRLVPNTVDGIAVGSWNRIGVTFRLKN